MDSRAYILPIKRAVAQAKQIAKSMDLEVLHGVVDYLWVKGGDAYLFK